MSFQSSHPTSYKAYTYHLPLLSLEFLLPKQAFGCALFQSALLYLVPQQKWRRVNTQISKASSPIPHIGVLGCKWSSSRSWGFTSSNTKVATYSLTFTWRVLLKLLHNTKRTRLLNQDNQISCSMYPFLKKRLSISCGYPTRRLCKQFVQEYTRRIELC